MCVETYISSCKRLRLVTLTISYHWWWNNEKLLRNVQRQNAEDPSFFFISPCWKRTPCHPRGIKLSSAMHECSAVIEIFMQIPDDNRDRKKEREGEKRQINCIDATTFDMRKRDKINVHDGSIECNSSSGTMFPSDKANATFRTHSEIIHTSPMQEHDISFTSVASNAFDRPFLYDRQISINTCI